MRALMRSTLKSLAQLFQIPSESSGNWVHLFESHSSSERQLNFLFTNVLLVITEAVLRYFLKAFSMAEKQKSRDELYAN